MNWKVMRVDRNTADKLKLLADIQGISLQDYTNKVLMKHWQDNKASVMDKLIARINRLED